jgi:hypothetical protein
MFDVRVNECWLTASLGIIRGMTITRTPVSVITISHLVIHIYVDIPQGGWSLFRYWLFNWYYTFKRPHPCDL